MNALEIITWGHVYSEAFVEAWKESKDPAASAELASRVADQAVEHLRDRTNTPNPFPPNYPND